MIDESSLSPLSPPWAKIDLLLSLFLEARERREPSFIIVADSDTFPRQSGLSMHVYFKQRGLDELFQTRTVRGGRGRER